MRTLHLLRHAKSSWVRPVLRDHDRPLSRRGREASRAVAAYIADHHPLPDLVVASTAARTLETARIVTSRWSPPPPVVGEDSLYLATAGEMLRCIQRTTKAEVLMLVGHNPGTVELGRLLTGDPAAFGSKYPTAGLAVLSFPVDDWAFAEPASGRLEAFVRPRALPAPAA